MKKYPKYKDSGVSWIGEVPNHWKKSRYKDVLSIQDEKVGKRKDLTLLSLTKQGVIIRDLTEMKGKFPKDFESYKVVHPDNIILCLFDVDETPRTVGLSHNEGMITGAYDVFSIKNIDKEYFLYHYLSLDDRKAMKPLYKGLRKTIPLPRLMGEHIFIPPKDEQTAIVSFLDAKTAQVDCFIAEAEKEIEKLNELKQAIISRTVTKGLNPNAKMKDSGIEWIGEVPEGWNHLPFKVLFRNGKGLTITKVDLVDEGLPVISYGQIHSKSNTGTQLQEDLYRFVDESYLEDNKKCLVNQGDFIFADTSEDLEGIGNCVYIDKQITLFAGYHSIIAKSNNTYNNKYLAYLFKTDIWRSQLRSRVSGIKVFSLTKQILFSSKVILPPLSEQQAIVSFLDTKTSQIDSRIAKRRRQIELLQEYKQALISNAVTGKVRVR